MTTRKPSSDKISKDSDDQPPAPSSDDSKSEAPKSDLPAPGDQTQTSSQDGSLGDQAQPDGGKKKVTKRKPSSDKLAKDEVKEPVVEAIPAAVSGLVPQSGDEGEFTVKISAASPEEVQAIPAESSGIVAQVCIKCFCDLIQLMI